MKERSPEDQERIRKKAQELYERRGRQPGHELEDWLEAEKIVDGESQAARTGSSKASKEDHRQPISQERRPSGRGGSSKRD